jgi:potassium efflux system protein
MSRMIYRSALLFMALTLPFVSGQETEPARSFSRVVKEWNALLDRAEKTLARPEVSDDQLDQLRADLVNTRVESRSSAEQAAAEVDLIRQDLAALGPPPAEGAPPEPEAVAAQRKALDERIASVEGQRRETDLVTARAERLLNRISELRRIRFTERLLARGPSPLSPKVWEKALPELVGAVSGFRQGLQAWLSSDTFNEQVEAMGSRLGMGLLIALTLVWPLRTWLLRRFGYDGGLSEPNCMLRLRKAVLIGFVRMLLPSVASVTIYLILLSGDVLTEAGRLVAQQILVALVLLFVVSAFCGAALAPRQPLWRIVAINDHGARALTRAVVGIAAVFAVDSVVDELSVIYSSSLELALVQKFVSGLAISGLLLILLRGRNWQVNEEEEPGGASTPKPWLKLRFFLATLVCAIPLTALFGYVALSRVLATQFVLTLGLYVLVLLLRNLSVEAIEHSLDLQYPVGTRLRKHLALTDDGVDMLKFWLGGAVSLLIYLLGLVALLVLWGAGRDDLAEWLHSALFGFRIGSIRVSIAALLIGAVVFVALLAATRITQRLLEKRIFPRTRLDIGLRNSIRSAIGYFGFIVAAALAISMVGIDLSNLAIIAGALSVGIGFGLQNIVNNFVSGLILLIERPIKVGDWVVVGEHQGYVRKISVRATEIMTFDRASVFIPNSNLIANPVRNMTYADKEGRIILPLGLAYGTDTKKVRQILLDIVRSHPDVLRQPQPAVFLTGFGDSALNFELRAYINDVEKVLTVTSELCFAIEDAFRKEGIEIPFPQQEVRLNLSDVERVRHAATGQAKSGQSKNDPPQRRPVETWRP